MVLAGVEAGLTRPDEELAAQTEGLGGLGLPFAPVPDRAHTASTVYELLAMRWSGRFGPDQLQDDVSLGAEGLGLDSIEIVELVLDCEDRIGRSKDAEELLGTGPVSIGRLIDHFARS